MPDSGIMIVPREQRREGDVVVALDFGTSRSAALVTLVGRSHDVRISVGLDGSDVSQVGSSKLPTSILMKGSKGLHIGRRAEELYVQEGRNNQDWLLFKWFKMELHKPFQKDPKVEAFGGRGSENLSILLRECFKLAANAVEDVIDEHGFVKRKLFWVLTVPAIWSDFSKDLMRTAASAAGLIPNKDSSRLMLGIEPECAAVASKIWGKDTRFAIVDCGGGTLDITSHTIVKPQPVALGELKQSAGAPLGATQVDDEFLCFFSSLIGKDNYENLRFNHPEEFFELSRTWEDVKVNYKFDFKGHPNARFPLTDVLTAIGVDYANLRNMVKAWNDENPHLPVEIIRPPKVGLLVSYDLMKSLFSRLVNKIAVEVQKYVTKELNLDYLVLVGGFSKCALLKEKVIKDMEELPLRVVHSADADMSIVRGAAILGASMDDVVVTRKAKRTYGVGITTIYCESDPRHRQHKHRVKSIAGKERLETFSIHGCVGDDIEAVNGKLMDYIPLTMEQRTVTFDVLVSNRKDVFLEDEEDVQVLASTTVPIDMSLPFSERRVWVKFCFGGPEVTCRVYGPSKDEELGTVTLNFQQF